MGSPQIRDQTSISCTGRQILYHWAAGEASFDTVRRENQGAEKENNMILLTWTPVFPVYICTCIHPLQYSCLGTPWIEEPGRQQSCQGRKRVRRDLATKQQQYLYELNYICVYIFAKNYIGMEKKNISTRGEEWSVHAKSLQSCPTLRDAMNCSLPGSSVCEILQARILEWVAIPFSRRMERKREKKKKKGKREVNQREEKKIFH